MGQGDLSQRVPAAGKDELAILGRTFNQMAASLQQAEASRRAMTADIAHELRTPLAVQRAHLEALEDGIYPLSPESLQPIRDQNLLLNRLVEDLRTLALADSGQLALEYTAVDLAALAQRAAERFGPQAAGRGIHIQVGLPPACPPVWADPGRLEQILSNLLSNALRYTPDQGHIQVNLACPSGYVHLQVHDSGPGIPTEALAHVFERFYRADQARSRAEGGSGLGLAIARQLAELHGGALSAANHPQGGALFTLELPAAPAAKPQGQP
jgi:signal transduction histidine kinase